jgi:hypothetical protein
MGQVKEEEGVPRRFENPVEVPTAVFDGLETVQESRETSMLDHQAVQEIASGPLGLPRDRLLGPGAPASVSGGCLPWLRRRRIVPDEAAKLLGTLANALRKHIERGIIRSENSTWSR